MIYSSFTVPRLLACLIILVSGSSFGQSLPLLPYSWDGTASGQQRINATNLEEVWLERQHFNWIGGVWEQEGQYTVMRNAFQQETQSTFQSGLAGSLQNNTLVTRTYNVPGEPWNEEIVQAWDGSNWNNSQRITRTYTTLGDLSDFTRYQWNSLAWDTIEATQSIYVYDANNQITSNTKSAWQLSTRIFQNDSRERVSYNASMEIDTFWVDEYAANSWVPDFRLVDISWFDFSNEQPGGYVRQVFGNGFYAPTLRLSFAYTTNGSYEQTNLNWNGSGWSVVSREDHTYDVTGREVLYEIFDLTNNVYVFRQGFQWEYAYNPANEPMELIYRTSASDSLYMNQERDVFAGYAVSTADADLFASQVSVFPNPFLQDLTVQTRLERPQPLEFQLLDSHGRTVFHKRISSSNGFTKMTLPSLAKGVYFYRIIGEAATVSGTLLHP